jgi:hypothetical protein
VNVKPIWLLFLIFFVSITNSITADKNIDDLAQKILRKKFLSNLVMATGSGLLGLMMLFEGLYRANGHNLSEKVQGSGLIVISLVPIGFASSRMSPGYILRLGFESIVECNKIIEDTGLTQGVSRG